IGAMLFIIPGFPFITSGLDLSKLDMRSGLERLSYAVIIIDVATMMSGLVTMLFRLKPDNFIKLPLTPLNY
ncbi:threonine/serine exporter family protein, partial [Bifidobacterium pseudocatenulatum]|nr:threonine/serine exporter family protein [Bifidobacterium pseudocatenulatum]